MNPLLLCLLVVAWMATPLELSLVLSAGEGATGQARLKVWGIPLRWAFRTRQEGGRLRLLVRGRRIHTGERQAPPITPGRTQRFCAACGSGYPLGNAGHYGRAGASGVDR